MLDLAQPVIHTLPPLAPPARATPPPPPLPPMRPGFAWTVLARHGRRPLGFQGHLLVQAASRAPGLPVWSEVAVHETDGGALVGAIRHVVRDASGQSFHYAAAAPDPAALLQWLHGHDPLGDLPAEILLGRGGDTRAAAGIAAALRDAWRALLVVTFGGSTHPTA